MKRAFLGWVHRPKKAHGERVCKPGLAATDACAVETEMAHIGSIISRPVKGHPVGAGNADLRLEPWKVIARMEFKPSPRQAAGNAINRFNIAKPLTPLLPNCQDSIYSRG